MDRFTNGNFKLSFWHLIKHWRSLCIDPILISYCHANCCYTTHTHIYLRLQIPNHIIKRDIFVDLLNRTASRKMNIIFIDGTASTLSGSYKMEITPGRSSYPRWFYYITALINPIGIVKPQHSLLRSMSH